MRRTTTVIFGLFLFLCVSTATAQVTIGSGVEPDTGALLDLKQNADGSSLKGLLLPRVTLTRTGDPGPLPAHVAGMTVYNTATANDVTPGRYYNDGTRWVRLSAGPDFFYLPSFNLDVSSLDTKTVDLYTDVYRRQFVRAGNANFVSSDTSLAQVSPIYEATRYDYIVTDYDNTVITVNGISAAGVMTYTVLDTNPPATSHINIVMTLKK